MLMHPETETAVRIALDAVVAAAGRAQRAPDLAATKEALNRVWFAVHEAQQAIDDADRETRERALAENERKLRGKLTTLGYAA